VVSLQREKHSLQSAVSQLDLALVDFSFNDDTKETSHYTLISPPEVGKTACLKTLYNQALQAATVKHERPTGPLQSDSRELAYCFDLGEYHRYQRTPQTMIGGSNCLYLNKVGRGLHTLPD
jgi:hypothetical protein